MCGIRHLVIGIAISASLSVCLAFRGGFGKSYPVQVYYFPMNLESPVAISPEIIEDMYDVTSVVQKQASRIRSQMLAASLPSKGIDAGAIRLKMRFDDGAVLLCDIHGNVQVGKSYRTLSKTEFKVLRSTIVGCFPSG